MFGLEMDDLPSQSQSSVVEVGNKRENGFAWSYGHGKDSVQQQMIRILDP